MSKHGMKRLWAAAFLLTAAIIITGSGYNRIKTRTSDTENSKIPPSSKEAVLNLETRGKNKIQAGNRETMNRLAVTENGSIIFSMEKDRRKTRRILKNGISQAHIKTSSWLTFPISMHFWSIMRPGIT